MGGLVFVKAISARYDAADSSTTTSQNLNIGEGTNRLLGFQQTVTEVRGTKTLSTASTSVTYKVDAAGNLTSDGLKMFRYDAANRMDRVRIVKDGEEANIDYLHNAFGQRVFKGEPEALRTLPSTSTFSQGFIDWLLKNFGWMFSQAQANTSIGTAYVYGDGVLPPYVLMGEYDNGSASGTGRTEYIWLPTPDGSAQLMGIYRNGRFFSIHTDHLGTPRLMKNDQNKVVWQRPYSAFGTTPPTGVLQTTGKPKEAMTNQPELLKATQPLQVLNIRESFQYEDVETGMRYNGFRSLMKEGHCYTQMDPIGLSGGLNRPGYVNQNPLSQIDPRGLWAIPAPIAACLANPICRAAAMAAAREAAKAAGNACKATVDAVRDWMRSENSNNGDTPPLPDDLVGDQSDPRAGPNKGGTRHTSGPLKPENGGTGDFNADLDRLTGGTRPWQPGDKAPPGSMVGDNGIFGRPSNSAGGKSIDIPANGRKPHETLHYP